MIRWKINLGSSAQRSKLINICCTKNSIHNFPIFGSIRPVTSVTSFWKGCPQQNRSLNCTKQNFTSLNFYSESSEAICFRIFLFYISAFRIFSVWSKVGASQSTARKLYFEVNTIKNTHSTHATDGLSCFYFPNLLYRRRRLALVAAKSRLDVPCGGWPYHGGWPIGSKLPWASFCKVCALIKTSR